MHTRVGMSTKYLSDDFMGLIKACTEKAKKENMLAWLYDEDKWPSGFGGGYVTAKKENRQKFLLITTQPYSDENQTEQMGTANAVAITVSFLLSMMLCWTARDILNTIRE